MKDSEKTSRLFVYGTLLAGEANHQRLRGAIKLESNAHVKGKLFDTGCGYPALVVDYETAVQGEVYLVDEQQLEQIDRLESFYGEGDPGNYYDRVQIDVHTMNETVRALTYVFKPRQADGLTEIDSGDWRIYLAEGY